MRKTMKLISFVLIFSLIVTSLPNGWTDGLEVKAAEEVTKKQLITWDTEVTSIQENLNEDATRNTYAEYFGEDEDWVRENFRTEESYVKVNQENLREAFGITEDTAMIDNPTYTYQWYEMDKEGNKTIIEDATEYVYFGVYNNSKTYWAYGCTMTLDTIEIDGVEYEVEDIKNPTDYSGAIDCLYVREYNGTIIEKEELLEYFSGMENIDVENYEFTNIDDEVEELSVSELDALDYNSYFNYTWTTHYTDGTSVSDEKVEHADYIASKDGYLIQNEKQVDSYSCEVDLCYGYQVIDTITKEFDLKYIPFQLEADVESSEVTVRQNGKTTLSQEVYINDSIAVESLEYQWYVIGKEGKETKLEDETMDELHIKVSDSSVRYKVVVSAKLENDYKFLTCDTQEHTFYFKTSAGYLVTDKSPSTVSVALGDTVTLYIKDQVDDGYTLEYKWEKVYEDENGDVQKKEVGTEAKLDVTPTTLADFEGVYQENVNNSYYYFWHNYKQTVYVKKGDEVVETYEHCYWVKEDQKYTTDSNDGTIQAVKGEDVELYVNTTINDVLYTLEKTWYEQVDQIVGYTKQVDGKTVYYNLQDEEVTLPEYDTTLYYWNGYDSNVGRYTYQYYFYKEIPDTKNVSSYVVKGTDTDGKPIMIDKDYLCIVNQYLLEDTERENLLSENKYKFNFSYGSNLEAYVRSEALTACIGGKAKMEVVAKNNNESLYPISYKWEKYDEASDDYVEITDKEGKGIATATFEIAEVTKKDYGNYRVTVSDETGAEESFDISLSKKELDVVVYTPEWTYYSKDIGEKVSLVADIEFSEDIQPLYTWYRQETFEIDDDDMSSITQDEQDWQILTADGNTYTFTIADEEDYRRYRCDVVYKQDGVYQTQTFYYQVYSSKNLYLERTSTTTQIKQLGDSVTHSVRAVANYDVDESKITYQWYDKDTDEPIEGATKAIYEVESLDKEDFREVYCIATDTENKIESNSKLFTVSLYVENAYLKIKNEKKPVTLGTDVTMEPEIIGGEDLNFTYEWTRATTDPSYYWTSYSEYVDGTKKQYTITNVEENDLTKYRCRIYCDGVFFASYIVTLVEDTEAATIDVDIAEGYEERVNVIPGSSTTLAITATSSKEYELKYQWYYNNEAIGGATNPTYTIDFVTSSNTGYYYCRVMDEKGNSTDSSEFYVTLSGGLETSGDAYFDSYDISYEVEFGGSATLTATASNAEGYDVFYQWYKKDDELDDIPLVGETKATLTIRNITKEDLGVYYCKVSDGGISESINTAYYQLYVDTGLLAIPSTKNVLVQPDGSWEMFVEAKADAGYDISYQWSKLTYNEETDEYEYVDIAGATSSIYRKSKLTKADYGDYCCVVSTEGETNRFTFDLERRHIISADREFVEQGGNVVLDIEFENLASDVTYNYEWYIRDCVTGKYRKLHCQDAICKTKAPEIGTSTTFYDVQDGYVEVEYLCHLKEIYEDEVEEYWYYQEVAVLPDITYETSKFPETNHPNDKTYDIQAYREAGAEALEITFDDKTDLGVADMYLIDAEGTAHYYSGDSLAGEVITVKGDSVILLVNGNTWADSYGYKVTNIERVKASQPNGEEGNKTGVSGIVTPGTATQTPNGPSTTLKPGASIDPTNASKIEVGTKVTIKNLIYKVGKKNTVTVTGAKSKKIKSVSIPATVTIQGTKYKVTAIAAKAFSGYGKLKTVTIGKNVKSIGKQAFAKDKKLKTITVKGTALKKVGKKSFINVPAKAKIKVPKKSKKAYKKLLKKGGFKGKVK